MLSGTFTTPLSRDEGFRILLIGTLTENPHGGRALLGKDYDYSGRYWRVRLTYGD